MDSVLGCNAATPKHCQLQRAEVRAHAVPAASMMVSSGQLPPLGAANRNRLLNVPSGGEQKDPLSGGIGGDGGGVGGDSQSSPERQNRAAAMVTS